MKRNMLIAHGGGPTAVINASLYGVIQAFKDSGEDGILYGAIGGSSGILEERFIHLNEQKPEEIEKLLKTPASALGTSRFPLYEKDYEKIVHILKKYGIRYVLFNGGNGSMDTCGKLYEACKAEAIYVIGIPKTIDNDISSTDHSPGYGSAARYIATATKEIGEDVKSLPIHVSIIEAMGRNAGWITAASALARQKEGDAPHLIYLPEKAFDEENFLQDVKVMHERYGGVVVVASEGLRDREGKPIAPPLFKTERATYFGDVGTYLATLVIEKLGIKARSEKPGILGRASMSHVSAVDVAEAIEVGKKAVEAVLEEKTGYMIGIERLMTNPYQARTTLIPIHEVMMHEKTMPKTFINEAGNDVTEAFITWCRPLIGEKLTPFVDFDLGTRKEKI